MARPSRPIDLNLVESLARIHCTEAEIASALGMTAEGFRKRKLRSAALVGALEKGKDAGKRSLRRLQWEKATQGNVTMMIWLGKQILGQRDQQTTEIVGDQPYPVFNIVWPGASSSEKAPSSRDQTLPSGRGPARLPDNLSPALRARIEQMDRDRTPEAAA